MNIHEIKGRIKERDQLELLDADFTISTPYFPVAYPSDYQVKYVIHCEDDDCQLHLDITDFQLGPNSTFIIKNSNKTVLFSNHKGYRPPSTITLNNNKRNLIHIEFQANNTTDIGFRIELMFQKSSVSTNLINQEYYSLNGN